MKVIVSFGAENGFGNLESHGVQIQLAPDADHFEVVVDTVGVLARVSRQSLRAMVESGDALCGPVMTLKRRYDDYDHVVKVGGPQIFACDIEQHDDGIWLIPESNAESPGVLFFYHWDEWMTQGRTLTAVGEAEILAHLEVRLWKKHWSVIAMAPGAALKLTTFEDRVVPGTAPSAFHWFREEKRERVVAGDRWITLSANGLELTI